MVNKNKKKYISNKKSTISSMKTAFKQNDKEQFKKNIKVLAKM